jgi:Caspase domain
MATYPDRERSRMVLIGVSDYEQHGSLCRLPAVHNNLTALEAILTDPIHGVFTNDHCLVVDSPDSPRSLMRRLTRGANEAEDVLLVYYAGHGLLDLAGDLHLTVRETDPDQLAGTAVPYEWIRQVVSNSPALTRILILDCCFSGRAVGAMSSDSAALNQIEVGGTYILASTTANRISVSIPGEKYTAFTGELIKLLSAESKNPIKLGDLYRPLSAAMARRGFPRPKSSTSDSSGQLALRRPLQLGDKSSEAIERLEQLTPLSAPADAESIRAKWEDILEAVRAKRKVAWLLISNATVSDLDEEALTLIFDRDGEARGFADSGYDVELREVLQEIFGITPKIRAAASATGAVYEKGTQGRPRIVAHVNTKTVSRSVPADAETIRARWTDVLEAVKAKRKVAWLLLSNATVSDLDEETLTLTFGRDGEAKGFVGSGYDVELGKALKETFDINPRIRALSPTGTVYGSELQ